jgi:uncharacterized repeat protein (TIGR01451 family)
VRRVAGSWAVVSLLVATLASTSAWTQVLTTIQIDGNMSDWAAVLTDPYQRSDDGPGGALPDLDAPVQSTGRDLTAFAWTYDPSYMFFYVARIGSSSNIQQWWFYLDTNDDGLVQSGEPVIRVSWKGSNRTTTVSRYTYNAKTGGGDPMGDAAGVADGWDMPGTLSLVGAVEKNKGGSSDGRSMESRISWGNIGVAPGAPVRFHVASSNSTNIPNQLDDNMGGPGGRVGTTRIGGVSLAPDGNGTVVSSGFSVIAHTVTNAGASSDQFDLNWAQSAGFSMVSTQSYLDDGDGQLGAGDTQLNDTTGDGLVNTGLVGPGLSVPVLAVFNAPAGLSDGQSSTLLLTASSSGAPAFTDTATDVITVVTPSMTLVKSVDSVNAQPGDLLTYTVVYTSNGSVDAHTVTLVDPIPPPSVYLVGSAVGVGATIEFSHDGGSNFDSDETGIVTHIRWSFPSPLAPTTTGTVSFRVQVP